MRQDVEEREPWEVDIILLPTESNEMAPARLMAECKAIVSVDFFHVATYLSTTYI